MSATRTRAKCSTSTWQLPLPRTNARSTSAFRPAKSLYLYRTQACMPLRQKHGLARKHRHMKLHRITTAFLMSVLLAGRIIKPMPVAKRRWALTLWRACPGQTSAHQPAMRLRDLTALSCFSSSYRLPCLCHCQRYSQISQL